MRTVLLVVATLALAGCERAAQPAAAVPIEIGRYQIVPAPETHDVPGEGPGPSAPAVWRLDTKSGGLSYCYQAAGVRCNSPDTPPNSN